MTKKTIEQTWRWYGPNDPVTLDDVKQAGASGIVTALHHIPHGEIWPIDDILERKQVIESAGLKWSVVESVPVHEAIKTRRDDAATYINNYKETLRNLAACGIYIVCYNFMPVLDWTRTDLTFPMLDGSKALYFNWADLAFFDIHILKREHAEQDYSKEVLAKVRELQFAYTEEDITLLSTNILMGIPSEKEISLSDLKNSIAVYAAIGNDGLRENLKWFLTEIEEVCTETGVNMSIHPDDPPYPILGLPRVVSTIEDYEFIKLSVNKGFNGFCFCTGSLGAHWANNILDLFSLVKERVYFAHLRNIKKDELGNFYESDHLDGDVNMAEIMTALLIENQHREEAIPFRPDHGHQMLDDLQKITNPGYSAIGRLRGLAELRGLEQGILQSNIIFN